MNPKSTCNLTAYTILSFVITIIVMTHTLDRFLTQNQTQPYGAITTKGKALWVKRMSRKDSFLFFLKRSVTAMNDVVPAIINAPVVVAFRRALLGTPTVNAILFKDFVSSTTQIGLYFQYLPVFLQTIILIATSTCTRNFRFKETQFASSRQFEYRTGHP